MSESEILANYPSLRAVDLVQAWMYGSSHSAEIDEAIRANDEEADVEDGGEGSDPAETG